MKIIKDSVVYVFGEVLSKAIPFFLLPYFTRMFGVEVFGEFSLILLIITAVTILVSFGQEVTISRIYYSKGLNYLRDIVRASIGLSFVLTAVLIIGGILIGNKYLIIISVLAFFQSMQSTQLVLIQCQKKVLFYILLQLMSIVISTIATVFAFEFLEVTIENRLYALIIGAATASFLGGLFNFDIFKRKCGGEFLNITLIILKPSVPLILHQASLLLKGQVDRIIVFSVYSAAVLGVYSAGYQLASVYLVLLGAINKAVLPHLYESMSHGRIDSSSIKKFFHISCFFMFIPMVICIILPSSIYTWFFGVGFDGVKSITVAFMTGMCLQLPYLVLVNFFFYHGRNAVVAKATSLASVVHILFVLMLVNVSPDFVPLSLFVSNIVAVAFLYNNFSELDRKE